MLGAPIEYSDAVLAEILSARHFVDVRKTAGGPAPAVTIRAIAVSRDQLDADASWVRQKEDALKAAERALSAKSAAL